MDSKIIKYLLIILFSCSKSIAIEFYGSFTQGSFIIGKTDPDDKIKIDKKNIRVSNEGYFVFGIDRDRKYDVKILTEEEKKMESFPMLKKRLQTIEKQIEELKK